MSLTKKTIHGLKWSYISTISTALMQIGYTAVMARILNPSDFGLVAMSGVVLRFGNYFAQMGMSSAIIQKKDLSKENISAAFTSSIFLGFLFTNLAFFLAPLAKYVFENNEVVPLVKIMGLSFLINGFSLTALALIKKNMNFKYLAIAEITAFLVGYMVIGISSAVIGLGVWSLVCASLSQSLILAILTFLIIRHKVSLTFSWTHYKPLISFGSKVSLISFLEFIGYTLDTILIGRFFGDKKLGFYNRAQMLINLPLNYFITSFSKVLYPSLSIIQDNNEKIKRNIFLMLKIAATIILPITTVVSILSKEIIFVIFGPKWIESVGILRVLAFAAASDFMLNFIAVLFEAKGFLRQKLCIQIFFIIILVFSFYFSLPLGVIGIAVAITFSQFIRLISYSVYFIKKMDLKLIEFLKVFGTPLLSTIILSCFLLPMKYILNNYSDNLFINFTVLSLISLIGYVTVLFLGFNREIKRNIIDILMIILKRKNLSSFQL